MLYKKKFAKMEKIAGTNIPSDPKMWPAEVLKALVTQHPYVDPSVARITFTRIEPETKAAVGKIVVANRAAIPIFIKPDEKTKKLELSPLDVVFDGERLMHLNENSLREAIDDNDPGKKHDSKSYGQLPSPNKYIGDTTGDVTPLEYSGYPATFAGPRGLSTAGSGLLSRVIKNDNDLSSLFTMLNTHSGLNSIAETIGLRDSLDALKDGLVEGIEKRKLAHIIRRGDGTFAVAFENGDTRPASAQDLKDVLGPDFHPVMRQVMQRGWAMIRDFPTLRSVEQPAINTLPSPIENSGRYRLVTPDGSAAYGHVFSQMIDFDGSALKKQKVILDDKTTCEGKAFVGTRINEDHKTFPIGIIDTGAVGCFIDESFNASCTPSVKIEKIISMPNEPDILICRRLDTMTEVGLILVEALVKPQEINVRDYDEAIMPRSSYYIPAHMSFAETGERCLLVDRAGMGKVAEDRRPKATLLKNANMYHLFGNTVNDGVVDFKNMPEEQMRTKLAWYGADDYVIEQACNMKPGSSQDLHGLTHPVRLKKASKNIVKGNPRYLALIKKAADEAAEGVDETAKTQNPVEDPQVLDSILSLQFVSDETLEEVIEAEPLFIEVEDKLAKMLLASRQGEEAIHERGVEKALKGIGEARKSLTALKIEIEDRNE